MQCFQPSPASQVGPLPSSGGAGSPAGPFWPQRARHQSDCVARAWLTLMRPLWLIECPVGGGSWEKIRVSIEAPSSTILRSQKGFCFCIVNLRLHLDILLSFGFC